MEILQGLALRNLHLRATQLVTSRGASPSWRRARPARASCRDPSGSFKFRESTRAGAKGAPRSSAFVHIRPCTKQAAPQLKRRCLPANHPCANHAMRVACVSYGAYFIAAHHHPSISPPVNVNLLSHVPPSRRPVHLFSRLHCRCFTLHDR